MPKILFFSHSHYIGDTSYQVWIDLNNSLTKWKRTISKVRYSLNSRNTVWKPNFFPRQAMPKILFALHFHYIGDTPFRVRIDLNNFLTTWNRTSFKIRYSLNSQNSEWKPTFLLGRRCQYFFLFYTLITLLILHTEFGRNWTTPSRDEKRNISKICYSLFIRNNRKFPHEIITFFAKQAIPKFFLFYFLITMVIIHAEFGWIWTTPWTDEKYLFSKFANREFRNFPYEELIYSLTRHSKSSSSATLYLQRGYSIPSLVQFGQILDPIKITILKTQYLQNSQSSVWKCNFLRGQLYQFFFHSNYTYNTPYRV